MRGLVCFIASCVLWVQLLHPVLHLWDHSDTSGHHNQCVLCQDAALPTPTVQLIVQTFTPTAIVQQEIFELLEGSGFPANERAPPYSS